MIDLEVVCQAYSAVGNGEAAYSEKEVVSHWEMVWNIRGSFSLSIVPPMGDIDYWQTVLHIYSTNISIRLAPRGGFSEVTWGREKDWSASYY